MGSSKMIIIQGNIILIRLGQIIIIQGNILLIRLGQICDGQKDKPTPSYFLWKCSFFVTDRQTDTIQYIWTSLMIQKTLPDQQWDPIQWTLLRIQNRYMTNRGIQYN